MISGVRALPVDGSSGGGGCAGGPRWALKASAFLKRSGTKEKRTVSRASHYADHRYRVHSTLEFTDLKFMKDTLIILIAIGWKFSFPNVLLVMRQFWKFLSNLQKIAISYPSTPIWQVFDVKFELSTKIWNFRAKFYEKIVKSM